MADFVTKRFCSSERARLIQEQKSLCNVDSKIRTPRFHRCVFLIYSFSSATFATKSAQRTCRDVCYLAAFGAKWTSAPAITERSQFMSTRPKSPDDPNALGHWVGRAAAPARYRGDRRRQPEEWLHRRELPWRTYVRRAVAPPSLDYCR